MLKLAVIGNLGSDPKLKYAASGTALLRMNVAANYRVKSQDSGWEDRTEWVRVTVFGARAESLSNLLTKGMRVYVDGRLEARPWTTKDGDIRAGLEITANDVEFASARNENGQQGRPSPAAAAQGQTDDSDLPF